MSLDQILQNISVLTLEDQEFIVNTMKHRIQDSKRSQLFSRIQEAEQNYDSGDFSSGNVSDLMESLKNALNRSHVSRGNACFDALRRLICERT